MKNPFNPCPRSAAKSGFYALNKNHLETFAALVVENADILHHPHLDPSSSVIKFLPRALHWLGTLHRSDEPDAESFALDPFAMTHGRRSLLRSLAPSIEHFRSFGQQPILHVAEPGVGKTHFMLSLLLAVTALHIDKVIPVYLSLTKHTLPSTAIYTALYLAGYEEVVSATKGIGRLLQFCRDKDIGIFLVIDELQEGAAWGDSENVSGLHDELVCLREGRAGIWTVLSGSSLYTPCLAFGEYAPSQPPERRFVSYKEFAGCLSRRRVKCRFDKPVSSKEEFMRLIDAVLEPDKVQYDSVFWSLESVGVEDVEDVSESVPNQSKSVWEARVARLYLATGGNMRKLFGEEQVQWLSFGKGCDGLKEPSEEQIFALLRKEAAEYQTRAESANKGDRLNAAYVAVMTSLFKRNVAVMERPELGDNPAQFQVFGLQSICAGDIIREDPVDLSEVFNLADVGLISLELESTGRSWSAASFPTPALFMALLYLNRLKNPEVVDS